MDDGMLKFHKAMLLVTEKLRLRLIQLIRLSRPTVVRPRLWVVIKAYDLAGLVRTKTHDFLDTKHVVWAHRERLHNLAAAFAEQAGASAEIGAIPGRLIIAVALNVLIVVAPGVPTETRTRGADRSSLDRDIAKVPRIRFVSS
jgi:hypothetical protein